RRHTRFSRDWSSDVCSSDLDEMNDFLSFRDTKDKSIEFKSDSVFVTKQFALDHDIHVGDLISLEVNDVTSNFTVTGVVAYYFGRSEERRVGRELRSKSGRCQ